MPDTKTNSPVVIPPASKTLLAKEMDRLMALYKLYSNKQAFIGGSQALSNKSPEMDADNFYLQRTRNAALCGFCDLPIDVQLEILAYLSPKQLARASEVSRYWNEICSVEILWRPLLQKAVQQMQQIIHNRNPCDFQLENFSSKQTYVRCVAQTRSTSPRFSNVANMLQTLVSTRPRILMFGPGLESKGTSRLVRSILTDENVNEAVHRAAKFQVTGLVPGEFSGIGSGISLKLAHRTFNLVTLYTNVKSVRQRMFSNNQIEFNLLFAQPGSDTSSADINEGFIPAPAIRELCKRSQGFVFVVDATRPLSELCAAKAELFAMLSDRWSPSWLPLLVLSCSRDYSESSKDAAVTSVPAQAAIDIVRGLGLTSLNRRWLVQSGEVKSLAGVREGLSWLMTQV